MGDVMSYVTFPGLAGNYADTPDVNLLDADTAHLYQSVGLWYDRTTNNFGVPVRVNDAASEFSGTVQEWPATEGETGIGYVRTFTAGADNVPVVVGQDYSARLRVKLDNINRPFDFQVFWLDAVGGFVGSANLESDPTPPQGAWTVFSGTATAPAGAVHMGLGASIAAGDALPAGAKMSIDTAMTVDGNVVPTAFVPSLRIVGDLQLDTRFTCDFSAGDIPYLVAKDGGGTQGYALVMRNDQGRARIDYAKFDATPRVFQSDAVAWTDQQVYDMRYEWDIDAPRVEIFRDNVSIGSSTSSGFGGAGNSDYNANSPLFVGALNAGANLFAGDMFSLSVRDGIGGPIVAQFDAADVGGVL
jgi:hypothetical protein